MLPHAPHALLRAYAQVGADWYLQSDAVCSKIGGFRRGGNVHKLWLKDPMEGNQLLEAELWAEPNCELMTKQADTGKPLDRYSILEAAHLTASPEAVAAAAVADAASVAPAAAADAASSTASSRSPTGLAVPAMPQREGV